MRRPAATWLLAMLVGLGLLAAGWSARRPPGEASAEVRFARDMAAHHAQAVELSLTLLDRSADPAVRLLAKDIVLTQQAQIGQMQGWLAAWNRPNSGAQAPMAGMDRAGMGLASPAQLQALRTLPVGAAERDYLSLMVRHHQGGVAMAQSALQGRLRPEVATLARAIVLSQQTEIGNLRRLLRASGAPDPSPTSPAPATPGMRH